MIVSMTYLAAAGADLVVNKATHDAVLDDIFPLLQPGDRVVDRLPVGEDRDGAVGSAAPLSAVRRLCALDRGAGAYVLYDGVEGVLEGLGAGELVNLVAGVEVAGRVCCSERVAAFASDAIKGSERKRELQRRGCEESVVGDVLGVSPVRAPEPRGAEEAGLGPQLGGLGGVGAGEAGHERRA